MSRTRKMIRRALLFAAALAAALSLALPAAASDDGLVRTKEELLEALHNADSGDTILVGDIEFSYAPMGVTITKSVTIKSGTGGRAVFSGCAFAVAGGAAAADTVSVRFEDIAFRGFNSLDGLSLSEPLSGQLKMLPAMFFNRCVNASFSGCSFEGYYMANGGALYGIYSDDASRVCRLQISLDGCLFSGNAANRGGAIYFSGYGGNVRLDMTGCAFSGNLAAAGGAVYAAEAALTVRGCTFDDNRCAAASETEHRGGAILADCCELSLASSVFSGNAAESGADLALLYTESSIDGCVLGGGLSCQSNSMNPVTVLNSTVTGPVYHGQTPAERGEQSKLSFLLVTLTDSIEGDAELFGCALVGGTPALPTAENGYCLRLESADGLADPDGLGHLLSTGGSTVPTEAVAAAAGGRLGNSRGVFLPGDNSRAETRFVFRLYTGVSQALTVPCGASVAAPAASRAGFSLAGWCWPDGSAFSSEKLLAGAGSGGLEVRAEWSLNGVGICFFIVLPALTLLALAVGLSLSLRRVKAVPSPLAPDEIDGRIALCPEAAALSKRELEVLRLLLAGKKREELVAELFVAESTVKSHVRHVYQKLGVTSRSELYAKIGGKKQ